MFDLGNKKLIEMLEKEIERLEKEKIDFIKTVEYLTNKVEELKNEKDELELEIEELKQQLEDTEVEMNRFKQLYQEEREYDGKYISTSYFATYKNERFTYYTKVDDLKYIEMSDKILRKKHENNNKQHYVFFLKQNNLFFNDEYIKKMIKKKQVPTYCGIPFRNLQDYYEIIKFLKLEKYSEIIKENKNYELINYPLFYLHRYNGRIYPAMKFPSGNNVLLSNRVLKQFINDVDTCFCFKNVFFETYRELRYLIKKECYKNKEILNKCL